MKPQIFTIVPGTNGPLWMLAGISIVLLLMVALFAWQAYSSHNTRFKVSTEELQISSSVHRRTPAAIVAAGVRNPEGLVRKDTKRASARAAHSSRRPGCPCKYS